MAPLVRVVPFKLSASVEVDFFLLLHRVRRLLGSHLLLGIIHTLGDLHLFA